MIGSERGFSDFPEVLWSISFSELEDIWLSFSVLPTFKISEVVSKNLKPIYLYLFGSFLSKIFCIDVVVINAF